MAFQKFLEAWGCSNLPISDGVTVSLVNLIGRRLRLHEGLGS